MCRLRSRLLFSIGAVFVALTCIYTNRATSDELHDPSPNLFEKIASLESRVAELERRIVNQSLSQPQPPMALTSDSILGQPAVPVAPQSPPSIPRGSTPFQFNGGTYYIVPLTKEAAQ
jgi:hypothetical protein